VVNFVVLPLSAIPFNILHAPGNVVIDASILMLGVGLPIALAVRRITKKNRFLICEK
jgi:hypothetical protein